MTCHKIQSMHFVEPVIMVNWISKEKVTCSELSSNEIGTTIIYVKHPFFTPQFIDKMLQWHQIKILLSC